MPVIHIIDSIKILIYFEDHNPPHFHAEYNEYEELIEINSLETYQGKLPSKQRKKVVTWANENVELLNKKWDEFNNK